MGTIWTMGELLVEIMRPEAGCPLHEPGLFRGPFPSGAPGIFIDTCARLGHKAGIISGVGDDDFGANILTRLKRDGVDCRFVLQSSECATGCAFVTYFDDGSRRFLYHIGNTPAAWAKSPGRDELPKADFFHIMGCSLMASPDFCAEIMKAMTLFSQKGAKISFDPNLRPELLRGRSLDSIVGPVMENCAVLLPGVDELKLLSGCDTVEDAVLGLFDSYPKLEYIALKRGSKGCTIYRPTAHPVDFGVYPVKVQDPTGAGDCFDAAFLCGLCEGLDVPDAVQKATAAASLNTAAFGPMEGNISPQTVAELIQKGL